MTHSYTLFLALAGAAAACTVNDQHSSRTQAETTTYQGHYGTGLVTVRPGQRVTLVMAYVPHGPLHPPDPTHPPDPQIGATLQLIGVDGTTVLARRHELAIGQIVRASYDVPADAPPLVVRATALVQPPDPMQPPDPQQPPDPGQPPDPMRLQLSVEIAKLTVDRDGRTRTTTQLVHPGSLIGFDPAPEPRNAHGFARALGGPDARTFDLHLAYIPPDPQAPPMDVQLLVRGAGTGADLADTGLTRLVPSGTVSLRLKVPAGAGPVFALWDVAGDSDRGLVASLEMGNGQSTDAFIPPAQLVGFNPQPEPPAL